MIDIPRIMPISDLRTKHREIFSNLDQGPIVLAQRSREKAVLISVNEWRKIATELRNLRLLVEAKRVLENTQPDDWVTDEELERDIAQKKRQLEQNGYVGT